MTAAPGPRKFIRIATVSGLAILLSTCSADVEMQAQADAAIGTSTSDIECDPEQRKRVVAMSAEWPVEPGYTVHFNVLDPFAEPSTETETARFDPEDPHWGLPQDDGRELVEAYCTACHSVGIVMQQNMVETGWDATLTRMVADRGMPEMRPEIRQTILSYLTAHFGAGG